MRDLRAGTLLSVLASIYACIVRCVCTWTALLCGCNVFYIWYSMMSQLDILMKNLNDMELKYKKQIKKNLTLLIQTVLVIGVVVVMFFVSSLISAVELDIGMNQTGLVDQFHIFFHLLTGWIALFGALTLIILSEQDVKGIFSRLELDTLLFFAALFVMMQV